MVGLNAHLMINFYCRKSMKTKRKLILDVKVLSGLIWGHVVVSWQAFVNRWLIIGCRKMRTHSG